MCTTHGPYAHGPYAHGPQCMSAAAPLRLTSSLSKHVFRSILHKTTTRIKMKREGTLSLTQGTKFYEMGWKSSLTSFKKIWCPDQVLVWSTEHVSSCPRPGKSTQWWICISLDPQWPFCREICIAVYLKHVKTWVILMMEWLIIMIFNPLF